MSTPVLDIFHGVNAEFNRGGGLVGSLGNIFGTNLANLPGAPPLPFGKNDAGNESRGPTSPKSMSQIKSNLLQPALTSHYGVSIGLPKPILDMVGGGGGAGGQQSQLNLLCAEAVLPGSNLDLLQINNNYTGVTERHVKRRVFDDRINLTFYVDGENYLPIRVFEAWMSYIMNENGGESANNYNYRVRYPESDREAGGSVGYTATGLTVTKFERSYGKWDNNSLTYSFVKSYPIAVNSMPVSYEASNLLKCTVSLTYIRYIVIQPKEFRAVGARGGGSRKDPIQNLLDNTDSEGNYQSQVTDPTLKQIQNYTTETNPYYQSDAEKSGTGVWKYMS